jgi:hypothetical protein
MPRLRVVFDTNFYRKTSRADFEMLLAREREHSILAMANPLVVQEILSHVADTRDKDFAHSLAAIRKLRRHVVDYDGSVYRAQLVAPSDEIAASLFFNRRLPGREDFPDLLGRLISEVAEAKSPSEWSGQVREDLTIIRAHVQALEKEFADTYWSMVIHPLVPTADSWDAVSRDAKLRNYVLRDLRLPEVDRVFAHIMVEQSAKLLGLQLTDADREKKIDLAMDFLLIPIRSKVQLVRKIVESGYNLRVGKNANTFWDIELTFSTSRKAQVYGQPLWLVSGDAGVLRAAEAADSTMVVHAEAEYRNLLRRETTEVQEFIDACVTRGQA